MGSHTRLGMITPSLNTVLEPVTYALLADVPDVTAHFSRVSVTQVSLGEDAAAQFADEPMLAAARLLADARVHAICWNGTAGSWLGPAHDRRLCEAIARETGIPATSATLALAELFRSRGVRRYALVTPFRDDIQEAIIETYGREGFECVAERHLDSDDTFGYATIPAADTEGMIPRRGERRAGGDRCRLHEPEGRAPRPGDGGGIRPAGSMTAWRQRSGARLRSPVSIPAKLPAGARFSPSRPRRWSASALWARRSPPAPPRAPAGRPRASSASRPRAWPSRGRRAGPW